MGAVDKYNLKWNDFESGLLSGFQDIRKSQQFFDVTLICEASQIHAHKVKIGIWPDGPFKFCYGINILTKKRYCESIYPDGLFYLQCSVRYLYKYGTGIVA
jgi:hypothetical protein